MKFPLGPKYRSDEDRNTRQVQAEKAIPGAFGSSPGHTNHKINYDRGSSKDVPFVAYSVPLSEMAQACKQDWVAQSLIDAEHKWDPTRRWEYQYYYNRATGTSVERHWSGDRYRDRDRGDYETFKSQKTPRVTPAFHPSPTTWLGTDTKLGPIMKALLEKLAKS